MCSDVCDCARCYWSIIANSPGRGSAAIQDGQDRCEAVRTLFESTAPAPCQCISAPVMSTVSKKQRSPARRQETKTARKEQPRQQSESEPTVSAPPRAKVQQRRVAT
ncbi:hypothetical protein MTO96_036078 [Rhipicephalus appendiculatus]